MKRSLRSRRHIAPFMALLLSSSIHDSYQQEHSSAHNPNILDIPGTIRPNKPRNLEQVTSEAQNGEVISMTLNGVNPLSPPDIEWFQTQTQNYIQYYYNNDPDIDCTDCLRKMIDIDSVVIEVTDQNPPYDKENPRPDGADDGSDPKIKLTYTQTTKYTRIEAPSFFQPTFDDIVKDPFDNVIKRKTYANDYLKSNSTDDGNVLPAFASLRFSSSIVIQVNSNSFMSSIGFYAIIIAAVSVIVVGVGFWIYKCRKNNNDKIYDDGERYRGQEHGNVYNPSGGGRHKMQNEQYPSQLQLTNNGMKDEVSTIMVDPQGQAGTFSGGKSMGGFTESIAEIDPMYSNTYGGESVVSSSGGTFGSQTQKSKFSAMESILTPGMQTAGRSTYTEDDTTLFEDHINNRKGSSGRSAKYQYLDIYAPGGKLGVVIDTPNNGAPVVHNIKDTCPIADQLRVGDKLMAVDDEDVRSMTAPQVSKLISEKSNNPRRKFTVLRVVEEQGDSK